jgi:myosin heavy subunit
LLNKFKIFFKAGILAKLEDKRDQKINFLIIQLQTNCRRYLAIKLAEKKRVQYAAMKCIQRNVRISFALKKWKWWRLYTQLVPIINVQNNETILKQFKDELDETKKKNERLISEKNELKIINNQLENKLMNLQTEYVEERAGKELTFQIKSQLNLK